MVTTNLQQRRNLRSRLDLGQSGLRVSCLQLGVVGSPEIICEAFDAGVNYFLLSSDVYWPRYEMTRQGLRMLLERGGGVRDQIVVSAVSYLRAPMFKYLQFHEIVDVLPGLQRVDAMLRRH